MTLRGMAVAVTLAVTTTGGAAPMCFDLLMQTIAPCGMHAGRHGTSESATAPQLAQVVPHASELACHTDRSGLGCTTGHACPTAGPAASVMAQPPTDLRDVSRLPVVGPSLSFISYLAPPLSPPPQS